MNPKRVVVTLPPEMLVALSALAEEKKLTVAYLVRECVTAMYAHLLKKEKLPA